MGCCGSKKEEDNPFAPQDDKSDNPFSAANQADRGWDKVNTVKGGGSAEMGAATPETPVVERRSSNPFDEPPAGMGGPSTPAENAASDIFGSGREEADVPPAEPAGTNPF